MELEAKGTGNMARPGVGNDHGSGDGGNSIGDENKMGRRLVSLSTFQSQHFS